jgi:hypothetical protein
MVSRYLKLDPEFAYEFRKNIRSSEETFYNISQKINAYKLLRRKEGVIKNKLKIAFTSLKTKIIAMQGTFPEEERKSAEYNILQRQRGITKLREKNEVIHPVRNMHTIQHIENRPSPKKHRDISEDLEEIRQNLKRFN